MHEIFIAEKLLETAIDKCKCNGFSQIKEIRVKAGKASQVSLEALIFAFDALKIGSIAEGASLVVEEIPTIGCCKACSGEFEVYEDFIFQCPCCKSESILIKSGNGIELTEIEVED